MGGFCLPCFDWLELEVRARGKGPQRLLIDYAVRFRGADGLRPRKVFKWKQLEVPGGERVTLEKRHPFRQATTRKLYPGEQVVELQINGAVKARRKVRLL